MHTEEEEEDLVGERMKEMGRKKDQVPAKYIWCVYNEERLFFRALKPERIFGVYFQCMATTEPEAAGKTRPQLRRGF